MRKLKSLAGKRLEQITTVSWMEEGILFVAWQPSTDKRRMIRGTAYLKASDCTPEAYRKALKQASGKEQGRRRTYWILLQEAFPPVMPEEHKLGDFPVKLPDWMRWCWQSLTAAELPRAVLSGMAVIGEELMNWTEFQQEGTGYCLNLCGYTLFLGHGNDLPVRRISRRGVPGVQGTGSISGDWLLQTRMLFKNRTGMELKRVFFEEGDGYEASWQNGIPFQVLPVRKPCSVIGTKRHKLDSALVLLHAGAFRFRSRRCCQLTFQSLRRRIHGHLWERRLRLAAGLLFCGWGFMLLNACRHEALIPTIEASKDPQVESARQQLLEKRKLWEKWKRYSTSLEDPIHLIGTVAGTVPEDVELKRLYVDRPIDGGQEELRLELEGTFKGKEPARAFRDWIEVLQAAGAITEVEDLKFRRLSDHIGFTFSGGKQAGIGS